MMAKWASGKHEVFIDVNKLPLYPKLCKPVAQQSRTESRRLWKNVTYNLKVIVQIFQRQIDFWYLYRGKFFDWFNDPLHIFHRKIIQIKQQLPNLRQNKNSGWMQLNAKKMELSGKPLILRPREMVVGIANGTITLHFTKECIKSSNTIISVSRISLLFVGIR